MTTPEEAHRVLRIVHLARRFHPFVGGTERSVRDLGARQAADGHAVTVLTLDRDVMGFETGRAPATGTLDGMRVVRLPGAGSPRWALTLRPDRLVRELRGADVIHVHDLRFHPGLAHLVAKARGVPVLLHTHGLIFHTGELATLKRLLLRAWYGPVLRWGGSRIVAGSASDRDRLLEVVPALASRTRVVHNGLDLRRVRAVDRQPEDGVILSLGRVSSSKGTPDLVAALGALATARPEIAWRLVIAGDEEPDAVAAIRLTAARDGIADRITMLGRVDDAAKERLLATAAVAAFPSRWEGFGMALVEALAAGVPVVASDIPAHREVLGAQLEGALVDFRDPDAAAARLASVLEAPGERRRLAEAGRERSRTFDVDRLWEGVQEIYREAGLAM